jgi:N-acetylglucosamine malate deacetylase 2
MSWVDQRKIMNFERSLLAVFAHPDDETFRPGGTFALLSQRGVRVQVVSATRGGAGSCGHPPLCAPEELPALRESDLHCACATLGIEPPILLDYPDGRLSEVDPETLLAEILAVVQRVQPQVMISFGPDGLSGHPDHIAIGRLTSEAFHLSVHVVALYTLALPLSLATKLGIMSQIRALPDDSITLSVDVSTVWEAKLAAINCHRTQLGESPILAAPQEKQRLFLGCEYFIRAQSRLEKDFFLTNLLLDEESNP